MAQQTPNPRGTLAPGQAISVNKYTVQVERYLSQGGFAHVYLVRTATPVYNTTHHVLKRIAVASDAMLTDVKKEVDIMRILKGHPNIVHLIDAAWHRMSNGTYEVFILMEFCPGGGIIDMMNRRLRERLTEAEILAIFVDVCEGVAAMHNLRPALLHRDLKVENILQASATSYKLCDFGSATSVSPKPPSTTQEIRALEADLNRHTTLQYRAPEMVDPYLRRPVDEKSDVWALGVLLYKLCYYTTPFEEHGPLAILNVQYKIPPYPVYSSQMNSLIASILREHGTQRPSIFEILEVVHRIRGTRSRFSYSIPEKQPLSPQAIASNNPSNALDDLITFRSQQPTSATKNAGTQARDKVLEAIAPMRRGRPIRAASRSSSPKKETAGGKWDGESNSNLSAEEDQTWKAATKSPDTVIRGHKSGVVSSDAWKVKSPITANNGWETKSDSKFIPGFESDFSVKGFGDSFDVTPLAPQTSPSNLRKLTSNSPLIPNRQIQLGSSAASPDRGGLSASRGFKSKDAFEGLAFFEKPPPPTMGEVRKARTGLAIPLEQSFTPRRLSPQPPASPQPSPQPPPLIQSQLPSLPIEERYPSIEELDRRIFGNGSSSPLSSLKANIQSSKASYSGRVPSQDGSLPATTAPLASGGTTGGVRSALDSSNFISSNGGSGYRSQTVTGTAMRDPKNIPSRRQDTSAPASVWPNSGGASESHHPASSRPSRPSLTRKHRSSTSIKQSSSQFDTAVDPPTSTESSSQPLMTTTSSSLAQDWLTGDTEDHTASIISRISTGVAPTAPGVGSDYGAPVLRQSPRKRASFVEKSPHLIAEPLEGDVEKGDLLPPLALPPRPSSSAPTRHKTSSSVTGNRKPPPLGDTGPPPIAKTPSKGAGLTDNWSPVTAGTPMSPTKKTRKPSLTSDSGDDDGPEDVNGYGSLRGKTGIHLDLQEKKAKAARKSKRRQSSVHDLVDLWGGSTLLDKDKERGSKLDFAPKEQKRRSIIRPSSTAVVAASSVAFPRSSSPLPEQSNAHTRSNDANRNWKQIASTALSPPPLQKSASSSSSGQSQSRPRPQSMFVFPSSPDSGRPPSPGLGMPPEGMRTISASRRTSISNMVQRYEGMGGVGGYTGVPATPAKPLGVKLPTDDGSTGVGSSNTRYLKISPASSPVKAVGSVGSRPIPASDDVYIGRGSGRISQIDKTSPGSSPVEYVRKKSIPTTAVTSCAYDPTVAKVTGWDDSSTSGDPKSPSPERPYAGVSRLIDQWQRKAEESNTNDRRKGGGTATKRPAVVNGNAR